MTAKKRFGYESWIEKSDVVTIRNNWGGQRLLNVETDSTNPR